jgi:hypothetical protein
MNVSASGVGAILLACIGILLPSECVLVEFSYGIRLIGI